MNEQRDLLQTEWYRPKRRRLLVAGAAVVLIAAVLGSNPLLSLPVFVGVVLPDIDGVREKNHRSWVLHTFLAPAVGYQVVRLTGVLESLPNIGSALHFLTLGMVVHFVYDYVYPKRQTQPGARWPVRPVGLSAPWGLLWLGLSWLLQWYLYLAPAFLPWLVGY